MVGLSSHRILGDNYMPLPILRIKRYSIHLGFCNFRSIHRLQNELACRPRFLYTVGIKHLRGILILVRYVIGRNCHRYSGGISHIFSIALNLNSCRRFSSAYPFRINRILISTVGRSRRNDYHAERHRERQDRRKCRFKTFHVFLLTRKLVFDDCVRFVCCTLHNFSQRTHIFLFSLP